MPSLNPEFLQLLQGDYSKYPIFLESGTYEGETIFAMQPYFKELMTFEITEYYYKMVNEKNNNKNNIIFILGDTTVWFPYVLPTLKEPTIFFLDGHWSGCFTGKGEKTVPLLEELTAIANNFKPNGIIIIDDFRLFETEDWEYISKKEVITRVASRINKLYHLPSQLDNNDRLVIHINELK
jgi:hypothetical protein